jgi:hypothetical protein
VQVVVTAWWRGGCAPVAVVMEIISGDYQLNSERMRGIERNHIDTFFLTRQQKRGDGMANGKKRGEGDVSIQRERFANIYINKDRKEGRKK